MTTADFSKCVSAIEGIIKEEVAKSVQMPTSVKIFLPDDNGEYPTVQLVAELFYESSKDGGEVSPVYLEDILEDKVGDLTGRVICAISLDKDFPPVEELEDEVARAARLYWESDRIIFSAIEVVEHIPGRVRGTLRTYEYRKSEPGFKHLPEERDEEIVILFPTNA